ncbi:MAG: phosphate acyltransferase PlsX [Nitrospinota bacterium]|nr:phosphate acyltransferase PlsX [Nitrospinota bacterium]
MKIALDIMGGDYAPAAILDGAIEAIKEPGVSIILVGDRSTIIEELGKRGMSSHPFSIVHASQAVEMHESPTHALRYKRDSSIRVGLKLVQKGEAQAFVSAGNTGAVMASAIIMLKPLAGISRPAIAVNIPTMTGPVVLIDGGANVDCKPHHFFQFGVMGQVYSKYAFGRQNPRVGILCNGEEDEKGNEVVKESFKIFKSHSRNFIGNIDGKLLYNGVADVVVTDGFVGNIALKVSESLAGMISSSLRGIFATNLRTKIGYLLIKPYLEGFKKKIDYTEYGGAPLLGINGICIIAHGSSNKKAIKSAVLQAKKLVANKIIEHIKDDLALNPAINTDKKDDGENGGLWDKIRNQFTPLSE